MRSLTNGLKYRSSVIHRRMQKGCRAVRVPGDGKAPLLYLEWDALNPFSPIQLTKGDVISRQAGPCRGQEGTGFRIGNDYPPRSA